MRRKIMLIYFFCLLLAIWILMPIYYIVIVSFEYRLEAYAVPTPLIPRIPTPSNYLRVLDFSAYNVLNGKLEGPSGFPVRSSLVNSFVVAGAASLITVAVASPAGYALGRLRIPKKNLLLLGLLGSRTLPPISIIVPFYIIGISLGLVGVLHGLIIMNLSVTLPIMTWVLMGVFASLPRDAENAARIDGCTRLQAMRYVVFPMARSGITAVGLLAFLMVYNEFLFSWILVQGTPAQTLQPTLASMWFMIGELNLMAAANGLGLLVPIVIALAFQRYITQLRLVDPVSMVLE